MRDLFKVPNSWDVPSGLVVKTLHYGHGFMGSGNQDPTGHALKKKKVAKSLFKNLLPCILSPSCVGHGGKAAVRTTLQGKGALGEAEACPRSNCR